MKLEDVKKGLSVYVFDDRGIEKVEVVKVEDGKVSGKIVSTKDFIEKLRAKT